MESVKPIEEVGVKPNHATVSHPQERDTVSQPQGSQQEEEEDYQMAILIHDPEIVEMWQEIQTEHKLGDGTDVAKFLLNMYVWYHILNAVGLRGKLIFFKFWQVIV